MSISAALALAKKYSNGGAVDLNPSPAQREAGNYKKRHIEFQGIPITIENPKGTIRSGTNSNGKKWANRMAADYGYIKRTEGKDGDQVDAFVGPNKRSNKVFVIDQLHHSIVKFDEHKCLLGFNTEKQALTAYHKSYGRKYGSHHTVGAVTEMSIDAFKEWLKGGGGKKPVSPEVPQYQTGGVVDALSKVGSALYEGAKDWASYPGEVMKQETPELPQTGEWTEEDEYRRQAAMAAQQERAAHWGGESALNLYGTSAPFRMPRRAPVPAPAAIEPETVDVGRRQVLGGLGAAAAAAAMPKAAMKLFEHPAFETAAPKVAEAVKYLNPMRFAHLPEWEVFTPQTYMSLMARNMGPRFSPGSAANILGKYIPDAWNVLAHNSPIPRNAVTDAVKDWVATAERLGTPVQALAEKGPKASWYQDIVDFRKHLEEIKPELKTGEAAQSGFPDYLAHGEQIYHPSYQKGGAVKYTEPTPEDPTRYPYYESEPGPGDAPPQPITPQPEQPSVMDVTGVGPVPQAMPSMPSLPPDTRPMEPTLQEAQIGQQELPEGLAVNDAGQVFRKDTGEVISVAPRPGVLPLYRTSEGQIAPAIPKALDIIGSMGAGWSVPTRGAEALLGAGFIKGVKEPQKYGFKGDPFKAKPTPVEGFELDPAEVKASKQITGTLGTSEGGTFTGFSDGINRYIKEAKSIDHAREEVLAAKLYELAGVPVAKMQVTTLKGKPAISSQIISGAQQLSEFQPHQYSYIKGIQEHHAADAWLANWDWGGFGPENYLGNILVDAQGNAHRIDFGGALSRRGLGTSKGDLFTDTVGELQTLKQKQPSLLKDVTLDPDNPTANRIAGITDKQISNLVYQSKITNPEKMIKKLIARRDDLAKQYGIEKPEKPHLVGGTDYAPEDAAALAQVAKEQGIKPKSGTKEEYEQMRAAYLLDNQKADAGQLLTNHQYGDRTFDAEGIANDIYRMALKDPEYADGIAEELKKATPTLHDAVQESLSQIIKKEGDPWKKQPKFAEFTINEPLKGQETYWNDKTHQYQNTQPPKTEASFTPNEVTSLMKLNKLSSPAALVHSVMNHTPLAALKQKKITAKQNTLIPKHFDNADPKAVWEAMKDLSPEQISNLKQWFPLGMTKKLKEVETGQKATPKVSFISDDPNEVADMLMTTHNWDSKKIAESMYQMSFHKDPRFMDSVYKHLTHDIQPDVNFHITDLEAKKGKGEPTLSEQELYESKLSMQHAHEAAIASGEAGSPYGLSTGIKYSKKAPLPDEAFHVMNTSAWQQYTPKLTKGKSEGKHGQFGKESYYYEVPKLKNITPQQALGMGFNPNFTIFHATKEHRGATYHDPYPTKFAPYEELVNKTSEPAVFGADVGKVGHSYGDYAYLPIDDPDYHHLPPKRLVGEYIYRPPTGKVAEVNWEQINHFKSYDGGTMSRLIYEAKKRDLDMVIAHHISDLGSNNHTQYIILRPEGLRSLEAKFSKHKLSLPYPHYSIAGATVLVGAAEAAREKKEGQYAAGGSVKSTKETANYRLGTRKENCAICTMFRPPNSCTAVQGKISPHDTCDYFELSKRKNPMPLKKGSSQSTISSNIREFHTGDTYARTKAKFGKAKADKQAIAVAMSTARKYGKKKQKGGGVDMERMLTLGASRGLQREGMINSSVPGRTDKLPMNVKAGSYVLPADIPSALGQGNTMAGGEILKNMFSGGPYGMPTMRGRRRPGYPGMRMARPRVRPFKQDGGEVEEPEDDSHVPIIAAGGEWIISPEVVKDIGHGDMKAGHSVLDKFVLQVRKHHIDTLKKLKPPKK